MQASRRLRWSSAHTDEAKRLWCVTTLTLLGTALTKNFSSTVLYGSKSLSAGFKIIVLDDNNNNGNSVMIIWNPWFSVFHSYVEYLRISLYYV